jgi:hypothetical protein
MSERNNAPVFMSNKKVPIYKKKIKTLAGAMLRRIL